MECGKLYGSGRFKVAPTLILLARLVSPSYCDIRAKWILQTNGLVFDLKNTEISRRGYHYRHTYYISKTAVDMPDIVQRNRINVSCLCKRIYNIFLPQIITLSNKLIIYCDRKPSTIEMLSKLLLLIPSRKQDSYRAELN